jgi:signal transduction histidine kinase
MNRFPQILENSRSLKVLYVEDDAAVMETTLLMFERLFPNLDTAVNGQEGLDAYRAQREVSAPYDLVITDIEMPKMNGIAMSRHILEMNPEQPIVIISAYNDSDYLLDAISMGISGFLIKPVEVDQLSRQLLLTTSAIIARQRYDAYVDRIEEQNRMFRERLILKKVDSLQQDFLRNISHEIRTPLNGLSGMASLLRKRVDGSDEKSLRILDTLEESSGRIVTLMERMMTLSKLQSGCFSVQQKHQPLKSYLQSSLEATGLRAEQAGILLESRIEMDESIKGDVNLLQTIVNELLDNAVKFNVKGGKIACRITTNDAADQLQIDIKDNGIGIDESQHGKVFELFYQVDGSTTRAAEGAGIGLCLVKELTDLAGGTLTFESAPAEGSFFHVTLPLVDEGGDDHAAVQ